MFLLSDAAFAAFSTSSNLRTVGRLPFSFQGEPRRKCSDDANEDVLSVIPQPQALWIARVRGTRTRSCPRHSRRAAPEKVCLLGNGSRTIHPGSDVPRSAVAQFPALA